MDNHPGKMEVCQIERKNAIEWKPIKFKKQKKLARLKTRKGGLSKLEKKKKNLTRLKTRKGGLGKN